MMRHALQSFCFITLISCVNHDFNQNSPEVVLAVASAKCGKSSVNMQWFKNLLHQMEINYSLQGDIYAMSIDSRMIFVHQPLIMSCLACVLYDCEGNKIDPFTVGHEKLRAGMKPPNLIYRAFSN